MVGGIGTTPTCRQRGNAFTPSITSTHNLSNADGGRSRLPPLLKYAKTPLPRSQLAILTNACLREGVTSPVMATFIGCQMALLRHIACARLPKQAVKRGIISI